jgi:uncharacterized membrane protein
MNLKTHLQSVGDAIKQAFLNGVLVLLPISFTLWLFSYTLRLLKNIFAWIHEYLPDFFREIPYAEIIFVVLIVIIVGALVKAFVLESLIHTIEGLFFKIPLVKPVYFGTKQLIQAFTAKDKKAFQKVVLVEYPRKGIYSIGFVTENFPIPGKENQIYFSVFIPITPNPTHGFLIALPEEEVTVVDWTRQEAMSLIISGGIIQPDRFKNL